MRKILFIGIILCACSSAYSQTHLDQSGWKTSIIESQPSLEAPMRYEIANIGYNSYHWQQGGLIIIELFQNYYATSYEKYIVENGFGQGANTGSPVVKLAESFGVVHNARVSLGSPTDLSSSYGDQVNRSVPVYMDVKDYSTYRVKITYMQAKVDVVDAQNQIKIVTGSSGISIPNFTVPAVLDNSLASSGNLMVTGGGNHYIQNGNVGIGTMTAAEKLSVNGKIRSKEIKVEVGNWPDYVFAEEYDLPSLKEIERQIKEHGHLPGIASAAEVKADGIDLGEMNAKLLKKIEELTLYLIDVNRKVDLVTLENAVLIQQLKKIQSDIKTINR